MSSEKRYLISPKGQKSLHYSWFEGFQGTGSWNYTERNGQFHLGHAERGAVRNLLRRHRERKSFKGTLDLYVVRFLKDGTLGMSRPCAKCQAYLESLPYNINVFYSI